MCLSYILKGGCWSTCRLAASHGHTLTNAEKTCLRTYLTTQNQNYNNLAMPHHHAKADNPAWHWQWVPVCQRSYHGSVMHVPTNKKL